MLEVMTGFLVRAKSGLSTKSEKDLGSFFIAIDPSVFVPIKTFTSQVSQLVREIQAVTPVDGVDRVRVPGYTGEALKQKIVASGMIEIDDVVWKEFEEFYQQEVTKNNS